MSDCKPLASQETLALAGAAHFGATPANPVLSADCGAYDLDNLHIADTSFFPSAAAELTSIANALQVANRIKERLS